jgi:hypothetical protein
LKSRQSISTVILSLAFYLLLCQLPIQDAKGQRTEIGGFFGGAYYLGDINPHKHFAMTRVSLGGVLRHNFDQHFAIRLNGIYGTIEGSDAIINYNENRNLSFLTSIMEFSAQLEISFLPFIIGDLYTPISPYVFGGAGAFAYIPQAINYAGELVTLRNLGTEGQWLDLEGYPSPYSLISNNFIFGVGFKFNISKDITGGLEYGMRWTGTDYLDDVSGNYVDPFLLTGDARFFSDLSLTNRFQNAGFLRGDPTTKDIYSFFGFMLTLKLKTGRDVICPAYF